MASWIVGERRPGSCSMSVSGQSSFSFKMSYEFIVQTDDRSTSREQVLLQTPGMPRPGKQYGPLQAKCTNVTANRSEESLFIWFCEADFETGEGGNEQRDSQNNPGSNAPTDWIPTFRLDGFATREETITKDFTPATVTTAPFTVPGPYILANSAGQLFDPPYTRTKTLPQFSGVQFETASSSLKEIANRNDKVNSNSFDFGSGLGLFDARTLLLHVKSAELGYYYGIRCWKVEYQITVDFDKYDIKIADFGTKFLDGSPPFDRPYMDKTNSFVINGPLDGLGAKVLDVNGTPDASNVAELTFRIKQEISFADFIRTL